MNDNCEKGDHYSVVQDTFARDFQGVVRHVPGDCICLECKELLPAWWNKGAPELITEGCGDE